MKWLSQYLPPSLKARVCGYGWHTAVRTSSQKLFSSSCVLTHRQAHTLKSMTLKPSTTFIVYHLGHLWLFWNYMGHIKKILKALLWFDEVQRKATQVVIYTFRVCFHVHNAVLTSFERFHKKFISHFYTNIHRYFSNHEIIFTMLVSIKTYQMQTDQWLDLWDDILNNYKFKQHDILVSLLLNSLPVLSRTFTFTTKIYKHCQAISFFAVSSKANVWGSKLPEQETETLNTIRTCGRELSVNKVSLVKLFLSEDAKVEPE